MQNSFPYIDILIFGVIAIFLIFRLKNILGTKTGFEETNVNKKTEDKQVTNVVHLKSNKDNVLDIELKKILDVDPLRGALAAIELSVKASSTIFSMIATN